MSVFVISDTHGNYDGLIKALRKKGIIDKHGNRQLPRKHKVISIGDLANCVEEGKFGDENCLRLIPDVIDCLIVGNHEIPYLDHSNCFSGFHWYPEIHHLLQSLLNDGKLIPAYLHERTLISHAGFSRHFTSLDFGEVEVYEKLRQEWNSDNYGHSWFSSIGTSRGGRCNKGGILWCDFDDEFVPTDFPQVVGHTPRGLRMKDNAVCIDVGAKDLNTKPLILEVK